VPVILVEGEKRKLPGLGNDIQLRDHGGLADIAPTVLEILGLGKPQKMSGASLVQAAGVGRTATRVPQTLGV
jgi:2,3-bisphosphoglycerate-independent phosphoglycerate mutase